MKHLPVLTKAADLNGIYNAFEPHPLRTKEELAEFYNSDTMEVRTGDRYRSPMISLLEACTRPSNQNAHLLLGHRGCGKSTELSNLKHEFVRRGQPTVIIDANSEMDIFRGNHWDIMILITESLCQIAKDIRDPVLWDRIEPVVERIRVFLNTEVTKETSTIVDDEISVEAGAKLGTPSFLGGVLSLFSQAKVGLKYNESTREIVSEVMRKRVSEWVVYTRALADHIITHLNGKQPILIFEGLDKVEPGERIFDIFKYRTLSEMSFPVIYTFPISQFYSPDFAMLGGAYHHHTLPMIKVINIDGRRNDDGIASVEKIVRQRIVDGVELFEDGVLDKLIIKTGGLLRQLFESISTAATRAKQRPGITKIAMEDAVSALNDIKSDLTRRLSGDDYDKLTEIYKDPNLKKDIQDKQFLLNMLKALTVVEYNGQHWHDVHPLVVDYLKEREKANANKR